MGYPEIGVRTAILRALQDLSKFTHGITSEQTSAESCLKESDVIKQMYSVYDVDYDLYKSAIDDLEGSGMVKAERIPNSKDRCLYVVSNFKEATQIKKDLMSLFK